MPMKYVKVSSLPQMDDPALNEALQALDGELDKIARISIDWTDASQDLKTSGSVESSKFILGSYYLDSLIANNKVPDSDKWDGYQFADYLDQAVKQASSPQFGYLTIYKDGANAILYIHEDAGTHDAKIHYKRGLRDWETGLMASDHFDWEYETDLKMRLSTGGNLTLYSATSKIEGGTDLFLEATNNLCSVTTMNATVGSGANVFIQPTGDARIYRTTSGLKYKDKVKDLELDSSLIYNLKPRSYNSKCSGDDKKRRFHGMIADEIEPFYPEIIDYNDDHKPENYDSRMLATLMLAEIQGHEARIKALEARFNN